MNPDMHTLDAASVSEAFAKAVEFLDTWIDDGLPYCWFRGIKDNTLRLQPGAYWRTDYEEIGPLVTFSQEGIAYTDKIARTYSWATYYLAQHHCIPTRLLDWTESFSAALFFALDAWDGVTVPCIWIMQPCLINQAFLGWEGIVGPEQSEQYEIWLPDRIAEEHHIVVQDREGYSYDNDWPLALYPKKANTRIAAQQGTFTIHGRRKEPLDELFEAKGGKVAEAFARIDLKGCDKEEALRHLITLGVRRSAIYPDIDNLVRQIRDEYEW